jgi:hypothetical protein
MHIPNQSAFNFSGEDGAFSHWSDPDFRLNRILETHQDKVLVVIAAHEHRADLRLIRKKGFKG